MVLIFPIYWVAWNQQQQLHLEMQAILWIPRSKIIWSDWESISRLRCPLASWIPRFDFFKAIWEVHYCKCFKIHAPHSLWFPQRHKNCFSGNCFSLHCKYLVKQFPACCFILKNGNSWMKEQPISSKNSESRPFFSWSGNSWIPGYLTIKSSRQPLTDLCRKGSGIRWEDRNTLNNK